MRHSLCSLAASSIASLLQGLLCGVLQVIVQKLSETERSKLDVVQYADAIMEVLLQVGSTPPT